MKKKSLLAKIMSVVLALLLCFGVGSPIPAKAATAPGKVTVKSVRSTGAGKIRVSWKKVPGASKYQVQTAADKKFTKEKQIKTVSAKKTSVSVSRLAQGRKYYVRVRAYKLAGSRKFYGKWSAVKSIRLKAGSGAGSGGNPKDEGGGTDDGSGKELSEDDFEISLKSTYDYTGKEIRPAVVSFDLTEGEDYKVTYSDNVKVGKATITITGIGKYRGSIVKQFTISKAAQSIKATVGDTTMEIGKSQKITVSDAYGELTYEASPEGIVSVSRDGTITALKAGTATIYVSAGGDENHRAYSKYRVAKITVSEKKKEAQNINVTVNKTMTVGSTQKIKITGAYGELTWKFSTDGIVSIGKDLTMTALKEGKTTIYLWAGGDDTHKPYNKYYVGTITVTKKYKQNQSITATLENEYMHVGKSQKINVSGAYGEVTFEALTEGVVSFGKDGTITGLKPGWTKIYLNAAGDEKHYPITKQYVGGVIVAYEEATAYGFDCFPSQNPYKKTAFANARKADGTATLSVNFFSNSDEAWMDEHVTFEAQDVTANAYAKMFVDMGIAWTAPRVTVASGTGQINRNLKSPEKILLPYNDEGPRPCSEIRVTGKKVTVDLGPGTRVVKVIAKRDGTPVDYIYLGTTNNKPKDESAAFDQALYKRVRERIEAQLWTEGMSNGDKIGKICGYINATTHYPDSAATSPYENPTYWKDWSVDGWILEYWMFEDITLSRIMAFQGGITDCYAAEILKDVAKEDLGLPYLFDGKTYAAGEGVWIGQGSMSTNPGSPGHVTLWYQFPDGTKCGFDAAGITGKYGKGADCTEHDCKSKLLPL